jgi:hypothetical protein
MYKGKFDCFRCVDEWIPASAGMTGNGEIAPPAHSVTDSTVRTTRMVAGFSGRTKILEWPTVCARADSG